MTEETTKQSISKETKDRIFYLLVGCGAIAGIIWIPNPFVSGILLFILMFSALNLF